MNSDGNADESVLDFVSEASPWQNKVLSSQSQRSLAVRTHSRIGKPDAMAPIPKDFLFINKDSSNLGRDAQEAFTITSYVSRNHRKWLKNSRQEKLKASEALLLNRRHARALSQSSQLVPAVAKSSPPAQSSDGSYSREESSVCQYQMQHLDTQHHSHPLDGSCQCHLAKSQQSVPWSGQDEPRLQAYRGNADPFSAAALGIGPAESDAISSASRFLVFAAWPEQANSVFRAELGDFTNSHIDLRDSIAHEAELHAVIAAGYSIKARSAPHNKVAVARSFAHKVRSIELLREQLQNGSLAQTLTLLRLLISLDFNNGDFAAARVHMRGVRAMCKYDEHTNANLRELLLISDVWTSMALLCKPSIDPSEYDPGRLPNQAWYDYLTPEQTSELVMPPKNLVVMRLLGLPLHALLQASEEMIHSKAIVNMEGKPSAISKTVLWMSRRGSATTGQLVTQFVEEVEKARDVSDEDDRLVHLLRACTSLALILHMNFHWMDLPINYDFSKTFPAIEPILRRCSKAVTSARPAIQQLFAWLLFVCAMGDDVLSARGDLEFSGWAASTFQSTCCDMKLADPKLAKAMLLAIAYEEDLMDSFLEATLTQPETKPTQSLLPFRKWREILNHYVAPP